MQTLIYELNELETVGRYAENEFRRSSYLVPVLF